MNDHDTVYVVRCFDPRDPLGFMFDQQFFEPAEAEAARLFHTARGPGYYARPVEARPYTAPPERKSNFFGPPVRWDLPPRFCGRMLGPREAADRRYGGDE